MVRHAFHAMGTSVEVLLDVEPSLDTVLGLASTERLFWRLEDSMSRFDPASELSRLNDQGWLDVSDDFASVVGLALDARTRTGGRFDPTMHEALVAAGYDRSFDRIPLRASGRRAAPKAAVGGDVRIIGRRIVLESGTRLDLGGIAKGYAVDRAVELLAPLGPCLVNAGGDLAVSDVPDTDVWPVAVETPDGPLTLGVREGALATSGQDKRRWENGHHLIDPRTGRPAETDLLRVTVAAPSAVEAEVAAKSLFLAGADAAAQEADATHTPALLVTTDGRTLKVGGLA